MGVVPEVRDAHELPRVGAECKAILSVADTTASRNTGILGEMRDLFDDHECLR